MQKIDHKALSQIIDLAKQNMMNLSLPLFVSREKVDDRQVPSLAITEAVLLYLNSKGLLSQEVQVDYTSDYDEADIGPLEPKEEHKTVIG